MANTKIVFTHGTIQAFSGLYTLILYNNSNVVYRSTLDDVAACEYLLKYDSIKLIK